MNNITNSSQKKLLNGKKYIVFIVLIISFIFFLIELRYHYYFLNDDSLTQNLPYQVYNYNSILKGEIPVFNFHQYLGIQNLSDGQSAVFYPFNYISVFLSKLIFGNYFATIDIGVFIHLLIAGLGFFFFIRLFGINDKIALIGSITWPFNSFIMIAGNSWTVISGIAAYLPWLLYFSIRLYREQKNIYIFAVTGVRLLIILLGHPQYFVYTFIIEFITVIIMSLVEKRRISFNFIKYYFISYIFSFFLALPVVLPIVNQMIISAKRGSTINWSSFTALGFNIKEWLVGLIYPYASGSVGNWVPLNKLSYIGYISIIFVIVCLILVFGKNVRREQKTCTYVFMGIIVFLFLWSTNIISPLIYHIPILNRFRWHFKLGIFINFYLITLGTIGLYLFFDRIKLLKYSVKASNICIICLIILNSFNFIFTYTFSDKAAFGYNLDKIPYEEPLTDVIKSNGRIVTIGFESVEKPNFKGTNLNILSSMGYNIATLWGLYQFGGYELLIPDDNYDMCLRLFESSSFNDGANIPYNYFRYWGVKWYVVSNKSQFKNTENLKEVYKDNIRTVYYDEKGKPFFFWYKDESPSDIEYTINTNSINIKTNRNKDDLLVINFISNPFFNAYIDGKKVKFTEGLTLQMQLNIPKGKHDVLIEYVDPYFNGACLYVGLLTLLIALLYIYRRFSKKVPVKTEQEVQKE